MAERELELRIRALIEGSRDIQRLKGLLSDLDKQKVTDNSKGFRRGLKDSADAADRLAKASKGLRTVLGTLGVAFGASQVVNMTRRALELADGISTTAQRLGVGVEMLQEWRFAAEEAGIKTGTFDIALQRFTRRAAEAAQGGGTAKGALEELGISLLDANGHLRPAEQLLLDVADAMGAVPTHADRMRLAFKLFDTDGAIMLNLLSRGSAGIREMTREARDAGFVLSNDLVQGGSDVNRELEKMGQLISLEFARVVTENADAIKALAEGLATIAGWGAKAAAGIAEFGKALGIAAGQIMHGPDTMLGHVDEQIAGIEASIAELQAKLKRENLTEVLADAGDQFGEGVVRGTRSQMEAALAAAEARLEILRKTRAALIEDERKRNSRVDPATATPPPGGTTAPPPDPAENRRLAQIEQIIAKLREQEAMYGKSAAAAARWRLEQLKAPEHIIKEAEALATLMEKRQASDAAGEESMRLLDEMEAEILANVEADAALIEQLEEEIRLQGLSARARAQAVAVSRLSVDATDAQREAVARLAGELHDLTEKSKETSEDISEFQLQAARNIQSALAEYLFDPFDKGLDGMARGLADTVRRMTSELIAAQALRSLFGAIGNAGAGTGWGAAFSALAARVKHDGGLVGAGPSRRVSPLAFVGAARYHTGGITGLAPDEVPVIARRGEEVLTMSDPRHRANGGMAGMMQGRLQVELAEGLVGRLLHSPEGEASWIEVARRNRSALRELLG